MITKITEIINKCKYDVKVYFDCLYKVNFKNF